MLKRRIQRLPEALAGLLLAFSLGACGSRVNLAYTAPGWYLEKPRQGVLTGPQFFGGPFSYDQCEVERTKLEPVTAANMLCIRELTYPPIYGPY